MAGVMNTVELYRGERQLGQYQVQIARSTKSGWVAGIPPLAATVTNFRLILIPQTRKPHPPASIPGLYITGIRKLSLSRRPASQVRLKLGYEINLFVGWGKNDEFVDRLSYLLRPPPTNRFVPTVSLEDVERMINGINKL
jgi:hypothetical protein